MSDITPLVSGLRFAVRQHWRAVSLIGGSVGCLSLLFALAAGWLSPARLTPDRISDVLQAHDGLPQYGAEAQVSWAPRWRRYSASASRHGRRSD